MSKIAIVTDSTANIPADLVEKYHIHVTPQVLVWGDETYRDGIDIQPDQFYERLENAKVMPSTSQASPETFRKIFSQLLEQDYEILSIVLSSDLSGTMASAIQAKDMLEGSPIELVDSRTTAMAMGFLVLQAARAAADGASLSECKDLTERSLDKTGVMFAVDTLEFLHRGGRIGGGARLLGTALNLKPILQVCEGKVEALEKVRTRRKSLARLLELAEQRVGGKKKVHMAAIHANAKEDALYLLESFNGQFNAAEKVLSQVSPVVGTHTGPGTVGLAYLVED
jgi:DegV family protein with EDD domain